MNKERAGEPADEKERVKDFARTSLLPNPVVFVWYLMGTSTTSFWIGWSA
jgi:hypothetical protein